MDMRNYVHQVLIEENPYIDCYDVRDRYITYEDLAANICFDLQEGLDGAKVKDHIVYWLATEFGSENLNEHAVERVCNRIRVMIYSDEVKQNYFNG